MIKQQKGIDIIQLCGGDASDEPHTGTFCDRAGLDDTGHISQLMLHCIYLCWYRGSGFRSQPPDEELFRLFSQLEAVGPTSWQKFIFKKREYFWVF